MVLVYARSDNGNKIVLLDADRNSLRCRQRNRNINNEKVNSMKFASYKETMKNMRKYDTKVVGPFEFNTISRL